MHNVNYKYVARIQGCDLMLEWDIQIESKLRASQSQLKNKNKKEFIVAL